MLRVRLFGPLEVWVDDRLVPATAWRTRPTAAAFKLLVQERGRRVPFDRLIEALWPNSATGEAGRNSLHGAIRTIRSLIEPARPAGAPWRRLVTEGDGYRLVAEECVVDVDGFLEAVRAGRAAETRGEPDRAVAAYQEAMALRRGEYLADDPYADWALAAREQLRTAYVEAAESLGALLVASGQHDQAVAELERAIGVDPLNERAYRLLMRAHAAGGHRSHALAVYARLRDRLSAAIGLAPDAATERLRARIATADGPAVGTAPRRPPGASRPVPFLGRAAELAALSAAWARGAVEPGHLVLVRGPSGIGKTRLIERFARALEPSAGGAAAVLRVAAHEADRTRTLAAPLDLLGRWLEDGATAGQLQGLGPHAATLATLLPQTRRVWPGCPDPAAPPDETARLEALTQAVALLRGTGRTLLVLDDAHWADAASVAWLGYARRRLPAGTVLVAATRVEGGADDGLAAVVAEARRAERLTVIDIAPLSLAEIEQLARAALDLGPESADVAGRLYAATGGHTLFVVETVRELARTGRAAWREGSLVLPRSLREAIASRLAALDATAREALAIACVIGTPFRAPLLAEALARPVGEALDALDRLLDHHLLVATDDGHGYAVQHAAVRGHVYDELGPGRRQEWHRRVASAIAATGGSDEAELRHLLLAEADDRAIAPVALRAGEAALRRHAYGEAIGCLETARVRLAARGDELAPVLERLGEAYAGAGRVEEAVVAFEHLLARAGDALARAGLRRRMGQLYGGIRGELDRALALLDAAEAELGERAEPAALVERGRIAAARASVHFYRSAWAEAIASAERALALWRDQPGTESDAVEAVERIAAARQRLGQLDQAEAAYRRALAQAALFGDALAEPRIKGVLGVVLHHRGRLRQAAELKSEALARFRELGVRRLELIALFNLGMDQLWLGDFAATRALYDAAIEIAERLDARYSVMHALVGLGELEVHSGDWPAARSHLSRGIAMADEIGSRQRRAHADLFLAELALFEGDPARARETVESALRQGEALADAHTLREGPPILAEALVELGDAAAAECPARLGVERAARAGFVLAEGRGQLALARVLERLGRIDEAAGALARAEAIAREAGARYLLARVLAAAAGLAGPSDPRRAAALRTEARALARATGARPLLRRLEGVASAPRRAPTAV